MTVTLTVALAVTLPVLADGPIVAHLSVAGHLPGLVAVAAGMGAMVWAWLRRPTTTMAPLWWAAAAAATFVVASAPPVEAAVERSFAAHMLQHLALWVVVPILAVHARPVHTLRRAGLVRWAPIVERLPIVWLLGLTLASIVGTLYGTHLTPLYDLAIREPLVHELEHLVYLGASLALWAAVLRGPASAGGARVALLVATAASMVVLGMVLSATGTPLYPAYVAELGPDDALADQRAGAAVMWLGAMVATTPILVWSIWRWALREHQHQLARESLSNSAGVGHDQDRPLGVFEETTGELAGEEVEQ